MIMVSSAQMRELDRRTIEEAGVPQVVLMDRAGHAVADHICWLLRAAGISHPYIRFLAGPGNNGGDAIVAAQYLQKRGYRTDIWTFGRPSEASGLDIHIISGEADWEQISAGAFIPDLIVDGLLGTGTKGAPRGLIRKAVEWIQSLSGKTLIVAIDIPTGLDADTGAANDPAVHADLTITLGAPKTGLLRPEALSCIGSLEVADLGIPEEYFRALNKPAGPDLICANNLRALFPRRRADAHKGLFGHALLIGGSPGFSGAISMAARAAVKSGAGLVSAAVPESIVSIVAPSCPEAMVHAMELSDSLLEKCTSVLIGPGLGNNPEAARLVERMLKTSSVPLVLDADAINALSGRPAIIKKEKCPVVMTPHPGELAGLMQTTAAAIQADRCKACLAAAEKSGAIVILKGAGTLIADPAGELFINLNGNPGMATGGSGDVLAGILTGLLAQGIRPLDAAKAAVWIHGKSGDAAALRRTQTALSAADIINNIPSTFRRLTPR
ncbi:MAG TPA: NAD(P)H-hydrate dehydratase [Kiritimatiellia bacterium]|nr:NAD(P)H-hydrate dehydratase [Kiritimatiellia bacterium]HNS80641.1 NAD(P)H-hydrate dehydratase [Kiritimatiellia bacterium]HPA77708.1 NAD(P)H-hydrate dehydratase [Kiritimatiellia bacterium]HQQ03803.1 NAD(P)H-hydrate dehydratase [Kiritimatiellia bacterium]